MDLSKHYEICREQNLPFVNKIYVPLQKKIAEKQLPYYHELVDFVNQYGYITDRQFYYHLVEQPTGSSLRLDVSTRKKANAAYAKVINLTVRCRKNGIIPLDSILDDTDLIGTQQYNYSIENFLIDKADHYRSDWFENQQYYIECWLEKRALSRIFSSITDTYGVYLSVSGRYPSLAQVKSAIDRFQYYSKPKVILYFGDLDPTGKDMPRYLRDTFPLLQCNGVNVVEVTVNVSDVSAYNLPIIPLKSTDTRIGRYQKTYQVNYGVEIDALEPAVLRQKISKAIENYLDLSELKIKKKEDKTTVDEIKKKLNQQV